MKKPILLLLFLLIGGLFLNSCEDDKTVTPSEEKNYFPSTNGSYWIYTRTNVEEGETKTIKDSTTIVGTETIQGQTAAKYNMYFDGTFSESYFRYNSNTTLYALPSELLPSGLSDLLPVSLPETWVVLADSKKSSWEMFKFNVDELPFEVMGQTALLSGVVTVNGIKGGSKNIDVSGTMLPSQEFTTRINFTGKLKLSGVEPAISFDIDTKNYYADKIGLVYTETLKQDINVNIGFGPIKVYTIEESKKILIRYNISI